MAERPALGPGGRRFEPCYQINILTMTEAYNIEELYSVFDPYKLTGKMDACPCCISKEKEIELYSKPLRQLEENDMVFYLRKAMTTWGSSSNFKHFLPRFLDIYSKRPSVLIELDDILIKLEYAEWKNWNENEQKALIDFVAADWNNHVNGSVNEIAISDMHVYLSFLDFDRMLELWAFPFNKTALRNFVTFFYHSGNAILNPMKAICCNDTDLKTGLMALITRSELIKSLEDEFFENESLDAPYSDMVSIVLQMIEYEKSITG